ncbi:MAG: chemotaxis protein CheV [Candidatus Riflebacteria bacterium]|nr:chemotaxis protein CheV [Candidatus Riflebacteria bacterium]
MQNTLQEADQRSRLAFSNQMEMLVFSLVDNQLYGINVFKIIEVIETPKTICKVPLSHPTTKGTIDFRGKGVTVVDLGEALGLPPIDYKNTLSYIIICDYNNSTHGFLICNPDRLLTRSWDEIRSPTKFFSSFSFLTAVAYTDSGETIQLLDIEKVLADILGLDTELSRGFLKESEKIKKADFKVLVVDDSKTARMVIQDLLKSLSIEYESMESAVEAYDHLMEIAKKGNAEIEKYKIVLSDIEMPGMDGFTFTRKIRDTPELSKLYVMLHTSMSNQSNRAKAELVGANDFVAKFQPNELAKKILSIFGGKPQIPEKTI